MKESHEPDTPKRLRIIALSFGCSATATVLCAAAAEIERLRECAEPRLLRRAS
jgi:hypothetical protein